MKTAHETSIAPDFGFTKYPELRKWLDDEFPMLDPDKTMTRFIEYAEDSGRVAMKWTACFKRVVRTGHENGWKGICVYKQGRTADLRWQPVLARVKPYGFRAPMDHETPRSYETEFEMWERQQKRSTVTPFENVLRVMK